MSEPAHIYDRWILLKEWIEYNSTSTTYDVMCQIEQNIRIEDIIQNIKNHKQFDKEA